MITTPPIHFSRKYLSFTRNARISKISIAMFQSQRGQEKDR